MKITRITHLLLLTVGVSLTNCKDELNQQPIGSVTADALAQYSGVESIIVGAYSVLNGQFDSGQAYNSPPSNWSFGDVTSGDAYKGSTGTTDQSSINDMEVFTSLNPTTLDVQRKWACLYEGIKRCNNALRLLPIATGYDNALRQRRIAEVRFLRGHYYFELKKIYNRPPYIDETAVNSADFYVANDALSEAQLWSKIEDDFKAGTSVLVSAKGSEPGRPTRFAAWAYLCKAYIFQKKWDLASAAADTVIQKGNFRLMSNFSDVFLPENDNGPEIIFAVEHTINDGSTGNNKGSVGDRLARIATPAGSGYPVTAQGFHRPSQNLVNAYKTKNGLPALNDVNVATTDTLDPRIDHTVCRVGIPFLDYTVEAYKANWTRGNAVYGDFSPKKRMVSPGSNHYDRSNQGITDLNYYIIRYADLLLWKAEAAIGQGDIATAISYINQVRNRAKTSKRVQKLTGGDAAPYKVEPYSTTALPSAAQALDWLKLERRLELALEGHRFFDLVRWGDADRMINAYFSSEKSRRSYLTTARFTAGKHEYMPIPQSEIDLSRGLLKQNPNY